LKIRKAFKFRAYPNQAQQAKLDVQFNCARFVYNFYRAAREGYYLDTGVGLSYEDCAGHLAEFLKIEHPWLKEAHSQVLQSALKNLDTAYVNFFEQRTAYPNFHRKHDKQSARYPQGFKIQGNKVYLPKVGWVKTVFHRPLPEGTRGTMKNCTVSKTKSGCHFISIQVEIEIEDLEPKLAAVGIDLGLTTFATLSTGDKVEKPKHLHRSERRLKIRQRRLSRKIKGSKGRNKARLPVAVLHERIANQRKDFQHKLSRELLDEFGSISFESLNIGGMRKNHNLAKAISDAGWGQFVGFCEYKAKWSGGQVLRVDRFFPSSKLCSDCGEKHRNLTLNTRQWACLACGVLHDRDINAAINILNLTTAGAAESYAVGDTSYAGKELGPLEAQRL
jgi:putative transposase